MGIDNKEIKYKIEHHLKSAREFEAAGKPLHAVQVYNKLIKDYPDYTDTYFHLADIYEILGKTEAAINILKNYLTEDPENKEIRLYLGQFLLRNSKWEEANNVLDYMLPDGEPIVLFFLGYSHFMLEDYELAKINLLNFISYEEQSELLQEAYLYLAKIEVELSNFESALSFAKKAELLYGNFWELNLVLAVSYYNIGMYAHSVIPLEKAKKLNPNEPSICKWAGKIYLKTGDFLKAENNFLKFIDLTEEASSEVYVNLGEACYQGEKPEEAINYFEMALKIDPENKFALDRKTSAANAIENKRVKDG